ncbi:conserved protein of unknown function [Candidatus Hydrogenisulfobacillus filiaventi]|uniref:Uncharacterized protein n=1 Tax=Candidatus Hydrogenisulfobacillus filiaventi TaxID=2707344 RepID=A0A6F8ZHK2_9FIRM|nr:conserved protein of unknown function [Candidatus Hydrogenisulfobacillus filiaventi]
MADTPRIPDLDPREDYHWFGSVTLAEGLALLPVWLVGVVLVFLLLPLASALVGGLAGLLLALLLGGSGPALVTYWVMTQGPSRWLRHRRWEARRAKLGHDADPPSWQLVVPVVTTQRADPVWTTADGATWTVAEIRLQPTEAWDDETDARFRLAMAAVLRSLVGYGVRTDVLLHLWPLPDWTPDATPASRLIAQRETWWRNHATTSVSSSLLLRMGARTLDRDALWAACEAGQQAWESLGARLGTWHWLSADLALEAIRTAANPAEGFRRWWQAVADSPPSRWRAKRGGATE